MAQWDNLGRAATIAQLAGVDALGLISTILQAAQAVRHNRETCQELVQDLQMMEDLLKLLREPETMRQDEIKNVLNGLDTTLREAGNLVQSCRDCSVAYRIFMGWKQSDQFRRVKKKISKHLRFYPMISHADITRRLEELGKSVQSSSSSQLDAQETEISSVSSPNSEARNPVGTPVEIEMTQAGSESTTVVEHQQAGNNESSGPIPTKKWRFGLKLLLSRKKWSRMALKKRKVETPPLLRELTGPDFTFFHFAQLSAATNDFASECRIEGWGSDAFYKGRLADGLDIMIKRKPYTDTSDSEASAELENEVRFLAKLRHLNIVKLVGCCTERGEAILVYEYMANGRLTDAITGGTGERFLNWSKRFKIIIEIARGLAYLHECCGMYIKLGDFGPLSILLDSHMAPKITDFFRASNYDPDEYIAILHGARGYSARYSARSDVSRILALPLTVEGIAQKMDPALFGESRTAEILRCIQVALSCVITGSEDRPSMWDVLLMLSCESAVIPAVPWLGEASGSGWAHFNDDSAELSDSVVAEPRCSDCSVTDVEHCPSILSEPTVELTHALGTP